MRVHDLFKTVKYDSFKYNSDASGVPFFAVLVVSRPRGHGCIGILRTCVLLTAWILVFVVYHTAKNVHVDEADVFRRLHRHNCGRTGWIPNATRSTKQKPLMGKFAAKVASSGKKDARIVTMKTPGMSHKSLVGGDDTWFRYHLDRVGAGFFVHHLLCVRPSSRRRIPVDRAKCSSRRMLHRR